MNVDPKFFVLVVEEPRAFVVQDVRTGELLRVSKDLFAEEDRAACFEAIRNTQKPVTVLGNA